MNVSRETRQRSESWGQDVATLLHDAMPGSEPPRTIHVWTDGATDLQSQVFKVVARYGPSPNIRNALRKAMRGLPTDQLPLAVLEDERHGMKIAAMPLDAFLLLVSGWWAATQLSTAKEDASCSTEEASS